MTAARRALGALSVVAVLAAAGCTAPHHAATAPAVRRPHTAPAAAVAGTVYVEDHSGRAWPVTTAVRQWDAGLTASIQYGTCRAGARCIRVYEADLSRDEIGHTDPGGAKVRLNRYYAVLAGDPDGNAELLSTVCHELGHALGLPHSTDPTSCMQVPPPDDRTYKPVTAPSKADFAALNNPGGTR